MFDLRAQGGGIFIKLQPARKLNNIVGTLKEKKGAEGLKDAHVGAYASQHCRRPLNVHCLNDCVAQIGSSDLFDGVAQDLIRKVEYVKVLPPVMRWRVRK